MEIRSVWTCIFVIACATLILLQPTFRYLLTGWKAKRKDIMDSLSPNARREYFHMFGGGERKPQTEDEACAAFEAFYTRWYGRRFFAFPALLLALTGLTAISAVVISTLGDGLFADNSLFKIPRIASASVGGAYLWVVNDHISRARRLDFSPADIMWGVLRLAVAVPMGYGFSAIVKDDVAPFVAFAFGAFPLTALITIMQRLVEKIVATSTTADAANDDLDKLQGINKTILDRLSNEDVTTITQIAYCDPVRLTMRSNLSFNFVIDCMNQALAWMYLGERMDVIRPFGLRGAFEIRFLMIDANSTSTEPDVQAARQAATALFQPIADQLKMPVELLKNTFHQIAGDPYTIFLYEIWDIPEGAAASCGPGASNPGLAQQSTELAQ